jgi:hypothetical protein
MRPKDALERGGVTPPHSKGFRLRNQNCDAEGEAL